MPVTAKLSRKFYERLGDDIAGELVDWFNAVDATYRDQLKETNDLNWERFSATLRGENASMRGDLRTEMASMRGELRAEMADMGAQLRTEMAEMRADLLKWMFVYWTGTVVTLGALIVGMAIFHPR